MITLLGLVIIVVRKASAPTFKTNDFQYYTLVVLI